MRSIIGRLFVGRIEDFRSGEGVSVTPQITKTGEGGGVPQFCSEIFLDSCVYNVCTGNISENASETHLC